MCYIYKKNKINKKKLKNKKKREMIFFEKFKAGFSRGSAQPYGVTLYGMYCTYVFQFLRTRTLYMIEAKILKNIMKRKEKNISFMFIIFN